MSSLKAQLLKSGLADAKRAKKVHQQQLEAGKHAKDETKEAVQKAMAEKAENKKKKPLLLKSNSLSKQIRLIEKVQKLPISLLMIKKSKNSMLASYWSIN